MTMYEKMLNFYLLVLQIWESDESDFPQETFERTLELFRELKGSVAVPEFDLKIAKMMHENFDVREDYAEMAFQDLAPYLRDGRVRDLVKALIDETGTGGSDDLYIHVKNVRPLEDNLDGPAVVVVVVNSYYNFKDLMSENLRPNHVHGSMSKKVSALS